MNGRELTADDVEYNFHRMTGMGKFADAGPVPFGGAANLVSIPWESITATDKYTVVIHNASRSDRATTGPWMLADIVDGSSITYSKNPDYWGYDEKYPQNRLPYADELRWLIFPESTTAVAALRSGKLDFSRFVSTLDSVLSLERTNPEIAAHPIWFRSDVALATDVRKPPFDDIRVRRAMQMALEVGIARMHSGTAPDPSGLSWTPWLTPP